MSLNLPRRQFSSLSVKDLLDAREAYHIHLMHLENVVATAIGRYRFTADDRGGDGERGRDTPRTLANSALRDDSWPCVLVFVDAWIPRSEFAAKIDHIVPPRLYLPDGRVVPTCVIFAEKQAATVGEIRTLRFPDQMLGGGYPSIADVQGASRVATLGCVVSDGDSYYALTNAHVAGEPGRELYTLVRGRRELLGKTAEGKRIGKFPFERAYPGFPGPRSVLNVDAALVRLDDATRWTSQVYGIGQFDEIADLNVDSISLDLIGCPLIAFGAASGEMRGEIQSLFYRYSSVGGQDQLADLLIGPRASTEAGTEAGTADAAEEKRDMARKLGRHGNSGALWFLEQTAPGRPRKLRPIALHWGSQSFVGGDGQQATQYALGSSLGVIQRELGVDIVRDMNIGLPETWGKTGHYKVGQLACRIATDAKLGELLERNLSRISFEDDITRSTANPSGRDAFVPLADVPDLVWKRGGQSVRGAEGPNHFADMDQRSPKFDDKNLLELSHDAAFLSPEKWNSFYESVEVDVMHRGVLPFRVWQLFDEMKAAVAAGKPTEYIAAAGVLAHYVGDACQPLHVSMLHDGDPESGRGEGVHSVYETKMLDRFAPVLNEVIEHKLAAHPRRATSVATGRAAAHAIVQLMARSIQAIPPEQLIAHFEDQGRDVKRLFDRFGDATAERLIDGATVLASIWRGAWDAGGGAASFNGHRLGTIAQDRLSRLYLSKAWVPSVTIARMSIDGDKLRVDAA